MISLGSVERVGYISSTAMFSPRVCRHYTVLMSLTNLSLLG